MDLVFEWDEEKANRNETKHGVTFEEAKTIFNDPFSMTIPDPDHAEEEERWLDIGLSADGRLLVVWYTERNERIRIIGSRKATKSEERAYAHERN
ncbi:MAG: BrnT family toxin [Planctomycetota bacterium]|nr:BrnT family toxin [Planctomycetota bacterium]